MVKLATWRLLVAIAIQTLMVAPAVSCIGCFVCTSVNHANKECEDTFNNTNKFYKPNCWATRTDRNGLYPAQSCIKMTATDSHLGFSITVRDCVVDDGSSSETGFGTKSQCGWVREIEFEGLRMNGCVTSCGKDACNVAAPLLSGASSLFLFLMAILTTVLLDADGYWTSCL